MVYLHTDLKSYTKKSITAPKLRGAFKSLGMTIECAMHSEHWRKKYSIKEDESHEVRGLLFVHVWTRRHRSPADQPAICRPVRQDEQERPSD